MAWEIVSSSPTNIEGTVIGRFDDAKAALDHLIDGIVLYRSEVTKIEKNRFHMGDTSWEILPVE